jgi:hypothetical protein
MCSVTEINQEYSPLESTAPAPTGPLPRNTGVLLRELTSFIAVDY